MAEHNELGKWGEDEATLYLEERRLCRHRPRLEETARETWISLPFARWKDLGCGRGEDPFR